LEEPKNLLSLDNVTPDEDVMLDLRRMGGRRDPKEEKESKLPRMRKRLSVISPRAFNSNVGTLGTK